MKKMFLAALPLVLMLTACSSSSGGGESSEDAACERSEINIGVGPYTEYMTGYLGVTTGIFEEHGLDVKPKVLTGGSAAILPAVINGEIDFAAGNPLTLMIAREKGVNVQAVSAISKAGNESWMSVIMVGEGSPLARAADLEGKTVAVNSVQSLTEALVRDAIFRDGGDGDNVNLVEMSVGDMPAALAMGRVDAIAAFEPAAASAKRDGATPIADLYQVKPEVKFVTGVYFASSELTETCPALVKKFVDAAQEVAEYADAHLDEVRDEAIARLDLDPGLAEEAVMSEFGEELTEEDLQLIADVGLKYGLLEAEPDLDELLWKADAE